MLSKIRSMAKICTNAQPSWKAEEHEPPVSRKRCHVEVSLRAQGGRWACLQMFTAYLNKTSWNRNVDNNTFRPHQCSSMFRIAQMMCSDSCCLKHSCKRAAYQHTLYLALQIITTLTTVREGTVHSDLVRPSTPRLCLCVTLCSESWCWRFVGCATFGSR